MTKHKPPRDMVYMDVGHPFTRTEARRRGIVAFCLPRSEDDVVYGKVGETHDMLEKADYLQSDFMGRIDKTSKAISIAGVERIDTEAFRKRLDYVVSILAMDWPGYAIYWFGPGGSRQGERLKNPMKLIYIGSCPQFTGRLTAELIEMVRTARQITRRTFLKHVHRDEMQDIEVQLGYGGRLPMSKDPYVGYYKSTFYGYPVVFFDWSAMEYVFGPQELAEGIWGRR